MFAKRESPAMLRWGRAKVAEVFGADLRSLAAFRIVLAVLVLADLAGRSTDLYAHYTDRGVLPRGVLVEEALNRWSFSLSLVSGQFLFQALLFGVAALAALGLLLGYRTRSMTVVVWVLVLSIQWRNPLVLNTGDILLHLLLFWGMFLPLGAVWSVDRALKPAPPRLSTRFLSLATVALFLQIAFMYWSSAIQKSGPTWMVEGTAIYYALSIDELGTPVGAYLYQFPVLLQVLTFAAWGIEAFGPFLLFSPVFTGPMRTAAILAFMSLHLGIWLTMSIGIFSWVAAFCMVCFLPGWFWGETLPKQLRIPHRLRHRTVRLVHACRTLLRTWLSTRSMRWFFAGGVVADDRPKGRPTRAVPASSEAPPRWDDWLVTEATTEQETRYDAGAAVEPVMLRSSPAANLLAALCLLYVFGWNLTTVSDIALPERIVPLGSFLGLRQDWGVFAPNPTRNGGWYVVSGTLSSGQQVDLLPAAIHNDFSPREVSREKPEDVAGTVKNKYWRKYLRALQKLDNKDLRKYFGRYVCREWNERHSGTEQLTDLQLIYMREKTLPDYQRAEPERKVLLKHDCA